MRDVAFLRNRARKYRRLAETAFDDALRDSYQLLAEIDEEQADRIEKTIQPPLAKPSSR